MIFQKHSENKNDVICPLFRKISERVPMGALLGGALSEIPGSHFYQKYVVTFDMRAIRVESHSIWDTDPVHLTNSFKDFDQIWQLN